MINSRFCIVALLLVGFLTSCTAPTLAPGELAKIGETSAGAVLVDDKGMTVYIYDKDEPSKSNCSGPCAIIWPPVEAAPDAAPSGKFTLVDRGGGTQQWAYDGMPLYGYLFDKQSGDATGDGSDGVWHVVYP
jgi:predicted lipoprotein with Yx(FWY)xxD motif